MVMLIPDLICAAAGRSWNTAIQTCQAVPGHLGWIDFYVLAFIFGLVFLLCFWMGIRYVSYKIGHPMGSLVDVIVLFLGIVVVTWFEWWNYAILLGLLIVMVFAIIFFREGIGAGFTNIGSGASHAVSQTRSNVAHARSVRESRRMHRKHG